MVIFQLFSFSLLLEGTYRMSQVWFHNLKRLSYVFFFVPPIAFYYFPRRLNPDLLARTFVLVMVGGMEASSQRYEISLLHLFVDSPGGLLVASQLVSIPGRPQGVSVQHHAQG